MSDLQCPARFLLVAVTETARAERLAASLRHERVAAVYDAPPHPDGSVALAEALGLPLQDVPVRPGMDELVAQSPRALGALRELADLHRGETVVVVGEGDAGRRLEVRVDGDGETVLEVSRGDAT